MRIPRFSWNVVVKLVLYLLHVLSCSPGTVTTPDGITVVLTQTGDQLLANAPDPVRIVRIICTNGTRWIVPDTVADQSNRISLSPYHAHGSILELQLPTIQNVERAKFRGLYECCAVKEIPLRMDEGSGALSWTRRKSQPICCPCCPWYEQHRCLYRQMRESTTSRLLDDNQCQEVFLFTGTVDTQALRLHLVPGEPMLLPCPAQLHPSPNNSGDISPNVAPLTIHHQFFQHFAFDKPWFPFDPSERPVAHTYDPRYGLCLHEAQFPRSTLQLACRYSDQNQTRLVQTVWPPSPPMISPELRMHLVDPAGWTTTEVSAWDWLHKLDRAEGEAIYRVHKDSVLRVICSGSYTQTSIVKQPPPKLCFRWNWFESEALNTTMVNQSTDDWHLNACPSTQYATGPPRTVYATNEIDLPPIRRSVTVGCEILTPTRQAPATHSFIHVIPVNETENQFNWSITSNSSAPTIMPLLQQTVPREQTHQTVVLLIGENKTEVDLTIRFWFSHEAVGWPVCSYNQTEPGDVLKRLRRARDAWECQLSWSQQPHHDPATEIHFGSMAQIQQIKVHAVHIINGTTPRLTGLHGNVRHAMYLTCTRTPSELALTHLLSAEALLDKEKPQKYTWFMELTNGPQGLSYAFNLSQTDPTLALHVPGGDELTELWSYSTTANHDLDRFPNTSQQLIPLQGPRAICVQCQSSYTNGVILIGPRRCQSLSDWPLTQTVDENELVLLVRQLQMPIQSQMNSANQSTLTVLKSVPYELQCILLRGLSGTATKHLSPQLWPSVRWWTEPNVPSSPARNRTWRLSPYSRDLLIRLDSLNETGMEQSVTCHYGGKSIQTRLKSIDPTGPVILQAEAWTTQATETSNRSIVMQCTAQGQPLPNISWELENASTKDGQSESGWSVLHTCYVQKWSNFTQLHHTCNYSNEFVGSSLQLLRCRATNQAGSVVQPIRLRAETGNASLPNSIAGTAVQAFEPGSVEARWVVIIISFILLLLAVLTVVSVCLHYRTRKNKNGLRGLRPIANVLYARTAHHRPRKPEDHDPSFCCVVDEKNGAVRELVYLLGSTEQVARWHIPRDRIELTTLRLGLGHYGQVVKGWYVEPSTSPARIPVAIKTASTEPTSMQCLRNEIQLLPQLHGGKNIASMIGLIIGSREDLSDTYLVLQYCAHRSLAQFVRRYAHELSGVDGRTQKISIHSNDSGVYSINGNDALADQNRPFQAGPRESKLNGEDLGSNKDRIKCRNTDSNSNGYHLTLEALYELALGIANGVEYLAKHGIIHRDLASRNVLVDSSYTPRICDFGLAVRVWRTDSETLSDESYRITSFQKQLPFRILPLEALREQTFYLASDVWELGLLLWQLFHLETKRPFGNIRTAEELVHQLQLHFRMTSTSRGEAPSQLDRPGLVDDSLWKMMCSAWQADPKLRPSAQEFRLLLERILVRIRHGERLHEEENRAATTTGKELNYITCADLMSNSLENPLS